jgi:AraC-like DNA-binding protein
MLIEAIKAIVAKGIILQLESKNTIKFSHLLSEALQREYSYLSSLFSGVEGITLEKYIIQQRINQVKENLINTSKSLTQISDEFGYSSVSHLSRQLKSYTGKDALFFKSLKKSQIQIYPS